MITPTTLIPPVIRPLPEWATNEKWRMKKMEPINEAFETLERVPVMTSGGTTNPPWAQSPFEIKPNGTGPIQYQEFKNLPNGDCQVTFIVRPKTHIEIPPDEVTRKRLALEFQSRIHKVLVDDFGYSQRFFEKLWDEVEKK